MSDRELLELAAKAAGHRVKFGASGDPYIQAGINTRAWNPLTDDGDALRLAVRLSFDICIQGDSVVVRDMDCNHEEQPAGGDIFAATRRAILLAAAEIGRSMP